MVITDIRMPPTQTDEGLQVAARLRKTHPQVGVVLAVAIRCAGVRACAARGWLGRACVPAQGASLRPGQLVGAIREVARGGSVIDPKVVESLVAALGELVPQREAALAPEVRSAGGARGDLAEPLTERELEVLRLVAEGDSNQDIARKLVVTLATVKTHINHIFSKLDAESRVQVVARARALGLLPV